MRSAAFILAGIFLTLAQGLFYYFFLPFSDLEIAGLSGAELVHGLTPNLVLPLVIYLGIHEDSTARGALISFGLGWCVDILGGGPAFLFRFTMVVLWWLSRAASARVSAQSGLMRVPLAFFLSVIQSVLVLALLAIFGKDGRVPLEIATVTLPHALSTALF
ncbi:MAG: hypothetical protein MK135_09130, partial [Polyangiaceae bacterium]|nr:hypothetical protein [Polyangiaceae bacterium]